ncbi:MAG: DUF6782 family putative metallopeptidase [Alphaproteobacteria bacterium]
MKKKRALLTAAFALAAACAVPPAMGQATGADVSPQRMERLLDKAKKADSACEGGCGMMQTLDKHGITPRLVSSAQLDVLAPGQGAYIVGRQQGNKMYLNGSYGDDKLLETFAHETRHVWQKRDAGMMVAGMSPRQAILLNRYREADAFAFGIYFTYQYEKSTGKTLVKVPDDPRDIGKMHPYQQMYAMFKFDMEIGMPLDAAYRSLLRHTFKHVQNVDYDGDLLEALEKNPIPGLKMDDAAFLAKLRQMGSTDFGKSPSVLSVWTDADMVSLEKTGGISPENLARLQKLEVMEPAAKQPKTPQSPPQP